MKKVVFSSLTTLFAVLIAFTCTAQHIYFSDYPEAPSANAWRNGYIITSKGDTLYGRIRNTESVSRLLTPDFIYFPGLAVLVKDLGAIPKIAFQSYDKDAELQKFAPDQIKGFACTSSWLEQQIIETESQYNKNGFVKASALQKSFSLRDPYEDIRLLQRTAYDRQAVYESWLIDDLHGSYFLQRLAEGKLNLYFDTRLDQLYVTQSADRSHLVRVNYKDDTFFKRVFGGSKAIDEAIQKSPELKKPENFLSVLGIFNLEATDHLASKPDEVWLSDGSVRKGKLQMKGSSNLAFGLVNKALFSDENGKQTELKGADIKRIVKYVNDEPVIFDSFELSTGKKTFYQRLLSGKINVYYDARSINIQLQKGDGDISTKYKSYLLAKNEQPLKVTVASYPDQAKGLFDDKPSFLKWLQTQDKQPDFIHLVEDIKAYNRWNN